MPFCPNCGYEYKDSVQTCPDCGTKLVDKLPDFNPSDEEDVHWVALHALPNLIYAEMVKEVLEEKKIPYYIKSDFISGAYGVKGISAVGQQALIFVPEKYYKQSKEILHQMFDHI